ncbi:recombinase family protein [Aromatoleum bremense]|uniref:Resolvase n=1 Tax=Aromatoleum bremense TaxID=76115 RepID=A0ABX1P0Z7_9RHOO|nr:recombinase family protein [Aromatoleum bremense]NMG17718.1 resolvase [Aromatoleum bremense]
MAKDAKDPETAELPATSTYAYLRVSTDAQDVANQKLGVLEYCAQQGFGAPFLIEDTISGKVEWQKRKIGELLTTIPPGSVLVAAEITRLARSTLQVLEMLKLAAERGISVHVVKSRLVLDGSLSSKITATILALAGEIEREFIAARTKEALRRRKESGLPMGRPAGEAERLSLDNKATEIDKYLVIGLNRRAIAKLCGCSPNTLYTWLRRRRPEAMAKEIVDA